MVSTHPDIAEILHFWFGTGQTTAEICAEKSDLWWRKNEQIDAEIRQRFSGITERVHNGELADWTKSPPGILAAIIALDQFPRHIYRAQPASFAYDAKARELARQAVEQAMDAQLMPVQRVFLYLPFEHSEDLADQQKCVQLFQCMLQNAPDPDRAQYAEWLDFAHQHHAIIQKFGRFPHRNATLGRDSSPEEREFLTQPGSGF